MLKKLLSTIIIACLPLFVALAIPTKGVKRMVTLSDGSLVELTLRGDEDFHFWTAEDGRNFIEKDGVYSAISSSYVTETWKKLRRQRGSLKPDISNTRKISGKRNKSYIGKKKGLVILMEYPDLKFSVGPNVKEMYNDYFNKEGYTSFGMTGSVHDYFYDQSYGQFDLTFDVVGPYTSKANYSYYGQNTINGNDMHPYELVKEACVAAFNELNFADYDWDGDNTVDQVFVIYAGYSEAQGAEANAIWPHKSYLVDLGVDLVLDGMRINQYAVSSELRNNSGSVIDGIGTACHEFSHCLDLHDMYDIDYSGGLGTGNWDVLNAGSYNNDGCTPAGYTSYERWCTGWLEPKELSSMTTIKDMKALENSGEAYVMFNDGNRDEYYIFENRQRIKWDYAIPGHGLVLYHVDYDEDVWNNKTINDDPNHQRMFVVPADNVLSIYNLDKDPFPGSLGVTAINRTTTPANTVYRKNVDGTYFLNKNLDNITESSDGLISFVACRPDPVIPNSLETTVCSNTAFTLSWDSQTTADSYTVSLKEVPTSKHDFNTCLLLDEDFSKFYSKTTGFTDVSKSLSEYMHTSSWAGNKMYCTPKYLRLGTSTASGYFITPKHDVLNSAEVTLLVSYELFDENTPVTGYSRCRNNQKIFEQKDFELDSSGVFVFHVTNVDDQFYFSFVPDSRIYVNHLLILEGNWTEEEIKLELNKETMNSRSIPHKVKVSEFTTSDTNMTLENLDCSCYYYVKVKANNSVMSSEWSDEILVCLDPALAIKDISSSASTIKYYDATGRIVSENTKGLIIEKKTLSDGSVSTRKRWVK